LDRKDTKLVQEETVHAGFFRMVRLQIQHRLFKGGWSETLEREVVLHGRVGAIIPYDPKTDRVVLLEEFRNGKFAAGDDQPWSISIAAGMIEEGEIPEEMARREMLEETGCIVGRIEEVLTFYSMPGGSSQKMTLFCAEVSAENAGGIHGLAEEGEDIRVFVQSYTRCKEMLEANQFDNAASIIGLEWLGRNRVRLRKLWQ
jgi:ADP-ribose pyrophosphatase